MTAEFPESLVELHREYLEGRITRRQLFEAAGRCAAGGLTIASFLEGLAPGNVFGQAASREGSVLEVTVTDALTGARIPGAQVKLTTGIVQSAEEQQKIISKYPDRDQEMFRADAADRAGRLPQAPSQSLQTDQNGQAIFRGIAEGPYKLHAAADRYMITFYGSPRRDLIGDKLEISGDRKVVLPLTPASAIGGTITDDRGIAVSGVTVYLLSRAFDADGEWRYRVEARGATDSNGNYAIDNIHYGRYYLASGHEPRLASAVAPSSARTRELEKQSYAWSYYPGVADSVKASPIDLIPSGRVSGMDFSLQPAALHNFRGRFLSSGAPVPGSFFETLLIGPAPPFDGLMRPGEPSIRQAFRADSFEIKGLADGDYGFAVTLMVSKTTVFELPNQERGKVGVRFPIYDGFARFTVAGTDPNALDVRVELPTSVRGVVRRENGLSLPLASGYTAQPLTLIFEAKERVQPSAVALWNDTGETRGTANSDKFHAYAMPGKYKIYLNGLDSASYIKQVRLNGAPVSMGGVDLSAGSELDILISADSGTITGVVSEQRAMPVETVICGVLIPNPATPPYAFHKVFYTDARGSFSAPGVPPGSYRLFFWKNQDEYSCFDPGLLQRSQSQSTVLRVNARTTTSVNAQVIQI